MDEKARHGVAETPYMDVLLVEDDPGLTVLVHDGLESAGFVFRHASEGAAALASMSEKRPSLVVLDYSLPDMLGAVLVDRASHELEGGMPPFVVVTGAGDERVAVEMMKLGARDYLVKDSGFLDALPRTLVAVRNALVTEARLALVEEALSRSEARYRDLFDRINDAVFIADSDGRILLANAAAARQIDRGVEELVSLSVREISATHVVSPGDILADMKPGENRVFESAHRRRDGTVFPVEINVSPIDFMGRPAVMGVARDITERVRTEKEHRKLEDKVRQAQKMESLGVLAGGIAHDFNNLLTAILGHADLALMSLPKGSDEEESIAEIVKASRRAAELCRQMLAYAGRTHFVVETVDLTKLVMEMAHMLEVSIPKKASLRIECAPEGALADADATQIRQVFMNLVINAAEALGDGEGIVSIRTGVSKWEAPPHPHEEFVGASPGDGDYVFVEVGDTGCGMDADTRSQIFDPFFTTKFAGRGLGLAAVLGIVHGHKGHLRLRSVPGLGSVFTVYLPRAHRGSEERRVEEEEADWQGGGTALVVEDEEAVRDLARLMLERKGFTVLTASDGREALFLLELRGGEIDVVLLDLTMPHMDGIETLKEIHRARPNLPVVVASGHALSDVTAKFDGCRVGAFVQKPYCLSGLAEAMRSALSGH